MNTSILLSIRDEIALEGLEGITFEALWTRLQERDRFLKEETAIQSLVGNLDDKLKNLVFRIVVKEAKNGNIQFYRLPESRPPLRIFNRNEHFNEDTGTLMYNPDLVPEDIYSPVVCISNDEIRGSCRDYWSRVCITQEVVQLSSYRDFLKSQPDGESNIVAVASQDLRASAILGPLQGHNYQELKLESYCILEYVARKRFYGYLNSKKEGMHFKDTRIKGSFYYYRNELLQTLLLIQFPVYFYDFKRKLCHNSYVLYIPRFKPTNVNPIDWKVLKLGNVFLSQQVSKLSFNEMKTKLAQIRKADKSESSSQKVDSKKFRDFLQRYGKVFSMYREEQTKEFMVEFLRPLDRPFTVDDLYPNYGEKMLKDADDEEDTEAIQSDQTVDESLAQETEQELAKPESLDHLESKKHDQCSFPSKSQKLKRYFFERVYSVIAHSGEKGITRVQLLRQLNVPNSLIRNALKMLQDLDLIISSAIQEGRQKVYVYQAKQFCSKSSNGEASSHQSDRTKIRLEMIREFMSQSKFIDNVFSLRRYILWKEANLNFKIDMKTIMRLLEQLKMDNSIQIRCFRLSHAQFSRNSILIFFNDIHSLQGNNELLHDNVSCPTYIRENNRLYVNNFVDHLLLRSKFHYFAQQAVDFVKDINVQLIDSNQGNASLDQSLDTMSINDGSVVEEEELDDTNTSTAAAANADSKLVVTFHPSAARRVYGGKASKVERTFILYRYLFYLLVDDREGAEYLLPTDWRYYVPKLCRILPNLECSLIDVLIYMPISLFRDIYQISHIIPGLDVLLTHPVDQHQLLYQIDPLIRRHLLYNRKSVNIIFELIEWASHFGLLTLSERNKLQFSETIQFKLNTVVQFPKPMKPSTRADPQIEVVGSEYKFLTLEDFDVFVDEVEWHLTNRTDCPPEECPFDERLRIHSMPVFGFKGKRKSVKREAEMEAHESDIAPPKKKRKKGKENSRKTVLEKMERTRKKAKEKRVKPAKLPKPKRIPKPKKPKKPSGGLSQRANRQFWTREEDHFILKCRLASILLCPKSNFQTCISRTVISDLLHEHIGSSSYAKDSEACARRLLNLSKKPHIQQVIAFALHELEYIDAASLRPENRTDCEAMEAAFKEILSKILVHRFKDTDFFIGQFDLQGQQLSDNHGSIGDDLSSILSEYQIVDVSAGKKEIIFKDPSKFYDIHTFVQMNLIISALTAQQFTVNASGKNSASCQAFRRFYHRTMFKSLKNFPEKRVQETILKLIDLRMIMRNRKNLKQQRTGYAYRIAPLYFHMLTKYNMLDQISRKSTQVADEQSKKMPLVIENSNSIFGSIQFLESLSSDVIGVLDVEQNEPSNNSESANPRPIQFNIDIPENLMSIPRECVRNSERGRHVSRSLMLSQNSTPTIKCEILETEQDIPQVDNTRFTDTMFLSHIKVQISRDPHSEQVRVNHEAVIEKLKFHLRTFNPAEFESNDATTTALTEKCLCEFLPIKFGTSTITRQIGQVVIDAIRDVKAHGLGLKWEQLLSLVGNEGPTVEQDLHQFLQFCEEHSLIFALGIVNSMWVHRDQIRFWLVHSYANLESWTPNSEDPTESTTSAASTSFNMLPADIKQICFLPKLWKLPDGRMHLETLMTFFSLILGHLTFANTVMDRTALIDELGAFIAPVQLFELLDILITLECVRKSEIPTVPSKFNVAKPDANSLDDFFAGGKASSTFSEPPSPIEASSSRQMSTVYEATVDAFSRLSLLYDSLLAEFGRGYFDLVLPKVHE